VDDSIFHWWVTIEGAKGSFYEGEKFKLSFKFDAKYPTEPPEVTFVAKVPGSACVPLCVCCARARTHTHEIETPKACFVDRRLADDRCPTANGTKK